MNASESTLATFLPTGMPASNTLLVFGLLLAMGTLGGLLAARMRWLPTITGFMAVGLLIGPSGLSLLSPQALQDARVLVDIALGLILFKLGASLHPMAVLRDRQLMITSLLESFATFFVILGLTLWLGATPLVAVIAAAIAVSSSPAVLIHVAHEVHAEGPTVERAKALVALNNVLSFVLFSLALPFALHDARVDITTALTLPAYQLLGALIVGVAVAFVATRIATLTRHDEEHLRFAMVVGAVMLALGAATALKVSTLFTALSLGVACRWLEQRVRLTDVEFGEGADLFFVILFVFAGANLHLGDVVTYAPVALAYVLARSLAKVSVVVACGRVFKEPIRSSTASGLLLIPMAGLAIGLVQTTAGLMPELGAQVSALVLAAVAVFETIGPPIAAYALHFCGEAGKAGSTAPVTAPVAAPAAAAATPAAPRDGH